MEEVEALRHLHGFSLANNNNEISFTENSRDAKVKTLSIKANGVSFYFADGDAIKNMESLWKKNEYFLMHKNADGIVIYDKDGIRYLMLCEMKSSMGQIRGKAFSQVIAGFLRMTALLGVCNGKEIVEHRTIFIFTSQPISTEDRKRLQEIEMLERDKNIMEKSIPIKDKIVYRLYKSVDNVFMMPLRLICPEFHRDLVHVKNSILDMDIQWKLLLLPSDVDSEVKLDVNTL